MNMYFAVNSITPNFVTSLVEAFQTARLSNADLKMYALIDASFEFLKPQKKIIHWKETASSVYQDISSDELLNASPYLLPISDISKKSPQLHALLKTCRSMPMLSFIASPLSTNELIQTFQSFIEVATDDGQQFLLRFADTRILPVLDRILCKENNLEWRYGIAHWWQANRKGDLLALPDKDKDAKTTDKKTLVLRMSDTSFNDLIDAGENDAIIDAIHDQNPDLLSDYLPSNVYAVIDDLKPPMTEFQITNFPDRVMFCTTALATSKYFYLQKDFNTLLISHAWQTGKLGAAFSNLDDASWAEIESQN